MSKNRTQEQQEYRDQLAHTIKSLRKYRKGNELAGILLDNEKFTENYVNSLGENRKMDKKASKERFRNNSWFVIRNLEKFDLDNNKLAKRLLDINEAWVLTYLKHFKWLDSEVAERLFNLWYDQDIYDNIDSFDESVKKIIKQKMNNFKKNASYDKRYLWNSEDEEQTAINEQTEYKEEVKIEENVDVNYEHWNMSQEVKDYFNKDKFEKPFFEVDFDWKKMFLTKLQPILMSYIWFVWFIEVNWKYEIRYFIKSKSEGLWRCCPWYRDPLWRVSKLNEFNPWRMKPEIEEKYRKAWFNYTWNFSYERSTMVDFRLGQKLEDLYLETLCTNWKYYYEYYDTKEQKIIYSRGYADSKGCSLNFDKDVANRFIKMSKEIDITDDFSSVFLKRFSECTIKEIKDIYKNETLWIDENSFNLEVWKTYEYYHEYFEDYVVVNVCNTKMWWKDVEIFFSHTRKEPDLIWIDNIQYKDQQMNSYWIPAKQINAWWLTKKPMDYPTQCPEYNKLPNAGGYSDYKDIRLLYQENPLIKKYKELIDR